jgi:hypothetical protein
VSSRIALVKNGTLTRRDEVDYVCNSVLTGDSGSSSSTASTASALDISSASFTSIDIVSKVPPLPLSVKVACLPGRFH